MWLILTDLGEREGGQCWVHAPPVAYGSSVTGQDVSYSDMARRRCLVKANVASLRADHA